MEYLCTIIGHKILNAVGLLQDIFTFVVLLSTVSGQSVTFEKFLNSASIVK